MTVLISGVACRNQKILDFLTAQGCKVVQHIDERISLEKVGISSADFDGVICNGLFLYNDISKFINLRWIQLSSAGYDRVPMQYINEHHITVFNARGVYSTPMAEFVLGGVLQLYKRFSVLKDNQIRHIWQKQRDVQELSGKTVCIIGCGSVGQACAKLFSAFGCCVWGVDVTAVGNEFFDKMYSIDDLNLALNSSDITVLTLPLMTSTKHFFDLERLLQCKKGSILVNVSRGAVLVEQNLIDLLRDGHFGGAVLDVFDQEPLTSDSPFWDMQNVVLTPHNSFVGEGNEDRLADLVIKNLQSRSYV